MSGKVHCLNTTQFLTLLHRNRKQKFVDDALFPELVLTHQQWQSKSARLER